MLNTLVSHSSAFTSSTKEAEDFRALVRSALNPWSETKVASWSVSGAIPHGVFAELGEHGLFRKRWECGPIEGILLAIVLAEELALVSGGLGIAVTLHSEVFIGTLLRLGKASSVSRLTELALDGAVIGCFAVTESRGGSDIAAVDTKAIKTPTGWHVKGAKRYISNGGQATHAMTLVNAVDGSQVLGPSVVIVPLKEPGVQIDGFFPTLGINSCDTAAISMDIEVPADYLLGRPGTGLIHVQRALTFERIALTSQLIAAAHVALRLTGAHARRRNQFGRKLVEMQALRHRLADAQAELWAAESFLNSVVLALKSGRNILRLTAALKLKTASTVAKIIDECMQVFGGRGYTRNFPLAEMWTDVRLARIGAGTDEIMRETIATVFDRPDAQAEDMLTKMYDADYARLQTSGTSGPGNMTTVLDE